MGHINCKTFALARILWAYGLVEDNAVCRDFQKILQAHSEYSSVLMVV